MELNKKKDRNYILVKFINESDAQDAPANVDIVPRIWLKYDKRCKQCVSPFPTPPYSYSKIRDLHRRISNLEKPDEQWIKYPVLIVGHASK